MIRGLFLRTPLTIGLVTAALVVGSAAAAVYAEGGGPPADSPAQNGDHGQADTDHGQPADQAAQRRRTPVRAATTARPATTGRPTRTTANPLTQAAQRRPTPVRVATTARPATTAKPTRTTASPPTQAAQRRRASVRAVITARPVTTGRPTRTTDSPKTSRLKTMRSMPLLRNVRPIGRAWASGTRGCASPTAVEPWGRCRTATAMATACPGPPRTLGMHANTATVRIRARASGGDAPNAEMGASLFRQFRRRPQRPGVPRGQSGSPANYYSTPAVGAT